MGPPLTEVIKSNEEKVNRRLQILYARRMYERQIFMNDLKQYRAAAHKKKFKEVTRLVGPVWYQVLSVSQRNALDNLKESMHTDLIEGRPTKVMRDVRDLGIVPRPHCIDLLNCVFIGRNDPKDMLALLFLETFGYPVTTKRNSYPLNARLILTGIFYLGLQPIIRSLDTIFRYRGQKEETPRLRSKKKTVRSGSSPYLEKMTAALNIRPKSKKQPPLPLPSFDFFFDEDELSNAPAGGTQPSQTKQTTLGSTSFMDKGSSAAKGPPSPGQPGLHAASTMMHSQSNLKAMSTLNTQNLPPLPQLKRKTHRAHCDKMAGVYKLTNDISDTGYSTLNDIHKKKRKSQFNFDDIKKDFGMVTTKKKKEFDTPYLPALPQDNLQYIIKGVCVIKERTYFNLEAVTVLAPDGYIIHGGFAICCGMNVNIYVGIRTNPPPPIEKPCDCVEKWDDAVLEYLKTTKCGCGHRYDFYNEGKFPDEEMPYFYKATKTSPFHFDYNTIFETNKHILHIAKEFKRIWETDSMLRVTDLSDPDEKLKLRMANMNILPDEPGPEDYLKYAMKTLERENTAATLPEVYQAPELREWMRRRIHGPVNKHDKMNMKKKSISYWQMLHNLANSGYGHATLQDGGAFSGSTDWLSKMSLNKKFEKFRDDYKHRWFKEQVKFNNMMWSTMFHEVLPDKSFRDIYFSYLQARLEDVQLLHPYSPREAQDRKQTIQNKRVICK